MMDLAKYEKLFPGFGNDLFDLVEPFRDWKPKPAPPLAEFEKPLLEAIFWRDDIRGVRVIPPPMVLIPIPVIDGSVEFEPIDLRYGVILHDLVTRQVARSAGIVDVSEEQQMRAMMLIYQDFLPKVLFPLFCGHDICSDQLGDLLSSVALFLFLELRDHARRFKPLLELYRKGACAYGFDQDKNVLVIQE